MPLYNRGSTACLSISSPIKNKQTKNNKNPTALQWLRSKELLGRKRAPSSYSYDKIISFLSCAKVITRAVQDAHPVVPRESHLCPCTREELKDWLCVWNMDRKNPFSETQAKPKQEDRSVSGTHPVKDLHLFSASQSKDLSQATNN